jgi:hypothetical protein
MHLNGSICSLGTQAFFQQLRPLEPAQSLSESQPAVGRVWSAQSGPPSQAACATHNPAEHLPRKPSWLQSASTRH